MKKVLFLDRDGTLIVEPPVDFQIDSLEKLEFLPGVFRNLSLIHRYLDYELVIVSNQDGLGTQGYPYSAFLKPHEKFIKAFKNEGIVFDEILIDNSMPEDNAPTRKPRTGLLTKYLNEDYDLKNSYVIGDRHTDLELAKNLGAKGILLYGENDHSQLLTDGISESCCLKARSWDDIWEYLSKPTRIIHHERNTKETRVSVTLNLWGGGERIFPPDLDFSTISWSRFLSMEI